MKKTIIIILIASLLMVFVGCGPSIELEENQLHFTLDEDGSGTLRMDLDQYGLTWFFDLDSNSDVDYLMDAVEEFFVIDDINVIVRKMTVVNNDITIEIYFYDFEDLGFGGDNDLEDIIKDWDYTDAKELALEWPFVTYDDKTFVEPGDLKDYVELTYVEVDGMYEGAYYTIPGKIILAEQALEFEYISEDTIFVSDGYGWILFEE